MLVSSQRRAIYELLRRQPMLKPYEIADELDEDTAATRMMLLRMVRDGDVKRVRNGCYVIATRGLNRHGLLQRLARK